MNVKQLRELLANMPDDATVFIAVDKSEEYRACYEITDADVGHNGVELVSQYQTDYSSELDLE